MHRLYRHGAWIVSCGLLTFVIAGCGQSEAPPPVVAPAAVAEPQPVETAVATQAAGVEATGEVKSKSKEQAKAIAIIKQLGGKFSEDLNSLEKPIVQVSLRDCPVNDQGLAAISVLTDLEELDLGSCRQLSGAGLRPIQQLDGLRRLSLWNMSIDDASLEHLSGLRRLERLNLALCNHITDAGLPHVGRLVTLRELDLASTGDITDAGLAALKPLTQLRWLNLYNAEITDAGLVHLHGCGELETLVLKGTKVTDAGVQQLEKAMPKLKHIERD